MNNVKFQMLPVQETAAHQEREHPRSCRAGLYLLTGDGELARFGIRGEVVLEPELSAVLSFRLQAVLNQYRSGALEGLSLGLVADTQFERPWETGTMILGARLLGELHESDDSTALALASFEQRNRTKTVFQGMELLLNRKNRSQPLFPRFCPVLLVPEVDHDALCDRYGVDFIADDGGLYEVLDLTAPFASTTRLPEELAGMVERMRDSQTEAVCTSLDSLAVHGHSVQMRLADEPLETVSSPFTGAPEGFVDFVSHAGADTCFDEGDSVTGWLLEWFSPFNELTDTQREIIAGYETIRKVTAGTRLVDNGAHEDKCIYLVEGTLSLCAPDGETINVTGGTRRSRLPICALNPHAHTVTSTTDASIIVFSQKLIRRINEISRTYTSVDHSGNADSTTAISNGVQAAYLNRTLLSDESSGSG